MIKCDTCGTEESPSWWKCCPEHTTQIGEDVVCQACAKDCEFLKKGQIGTLLDPRVVERLKNGDWQFGHAGSHRGNGTPDCPTHSHHHHDEFCSRPTNLELRAAGIKPKDFKPRSRR